MLAQLLEQVPPVWLLELPESQAWRPLEWWPALQRRAWLRAWQQPVFSRQVLQQAWPLAWPLVWLRPVWQQQVLQRVLQQRKQQVWLPV